MNFPITQIERDLFEHLLPGGKVFLEVEEHLAALEADAPNECPNCNAVIGDHDSFCGEECKDAWWGIDKMQIERERIAGQREDAAEERHALAREDFEKQLDKMTDLAIEARRLERTGTNE